MLRDGGGLGLEGANSFRKIVQFSNIFHEFPAVKQNIVQISVNLLHNESFSASDPLSNIQQLMMIDKIIKTSPLSHILFPK